MKVAMRQTTSAAEVTVRLTIDLTLHEAVLLRNVIPAGSNAPALALRQALQGLVDAIHREHEAEVTL